MSKMAELRAYYYNKGDMLELVRYQKEELPKAALPISSGGSGNPVGHASLMKYLQFIKHRLP